MMGRLVWLALLLGALLSPAAGAAAPPAAPVLVVQGPLPPPEAIFAWSPDSRVLASLSATTSVLQLWDTRTGNLILASDAGNLPDRTVYSADFSLSADKRFAVLKTQKSLGTCLTITFDLTMLPIGRSGVATPNRADCTRFSAQRLPSRGGDRLVADAAGERVVAPGRPAVRLAGGRARDLVDLDLTAAGTTAVLLANQRSSVLDAVATSTAQVWSLDADTRLSSVRVPGAYGTSRWLGDDRFALIGSGDGVAPAPALVVAAASGRVVDRVPFRCATTLYGRGGAMLAGRASRCRDLDEISVGLATPGLWVRGPHQGWRPANAAGLGAPVVEAVAATADATRAAILTRRTIGYEHPGSADPGRLLTDQTRAVMIEGSLLGSAPARARTLPVRWTSDNERAQAIRFTPDGQRVVIETDQRIIVFGLADDRQTSFKRAISPDNERIVGVDDSSLITASWDRIQANGYDFAGAPRGLLVADRAVMSAGYLAGGLRWTATFDGSLRFYGRDWAEALTLHDLGDAGFVAVDLYGRYDSALGPDSNAFRWWFADEPLRSLPGQVFLRDYLEPALFARTLACTAAATCETALPPPPPVDRLNRTLPAVRIARVAQGSSRDTAIVEVEVRGVDAHAGNGRTRSGMNDLRLFRDGRLIGQWPGARSDAATPDLAAWRRANALAPAGDGVARHRFTVRLPTGLSARRAVLTAYAFNDDRVKSDTARAVYDRPWVWPARRRAYVLTIGINDYAQGRFDLDFAVADADLLGQRLGHVPGYAVRRLDLRGTATRRQATTQAIADAAALLAPGDHAAARTRLRALGVDPSGFAAATPDDLVVITFAGHGWADPKGNFYLVPSDEDWPDGQDLPDLTHLISAAQLTDWLRPVDFGDAAIVIDACNSAAVVATAGFKPGPLGDRGLGQLAYDKGILILAASQTDQKAHEDARLGHGILTAALARDGLDGGGFGRADLNGDGVITLDEWLRYAVGRLPTLSAEVAAAGRGRDFAPTADAVAPAVAEVPQQPSLFDFAGGPSPVVLGEEPWRARLARFDDTVAGWGRAATAALNEAYHVATDTLYGILAAVAAALVLTGFLLVRWLWRVARRRWPTPN